MGIGSKKTKRFDNGYKAGKWADHLHTAFGRFFLKWYKLQGFEGTIQEVEAGKFELAIKKKTNKRKVVKAVVLIPKRKKGR
jgi:hypothetical protein